MNLIISHLKDDVAATGGDDTSTSRESWKFHFIFFFYYYFISYDETFHISILYNQTFNIFKVKWWKKENGEYDDDDGDDAVEDPHRELR